MNPMYSRKAVFTIIANNYGAHARVLLRSLCTVQPDWERFVLIVDVPAPKSPVPAELARVVYPAQLQIPNPAWFFMRYNILEASTAAKPWMIEYLFDLGFDCVVYLDPDVKAYSPFQEVVEVLESTDLILTPHITRPYPDPASPNDLDIRKAGIYNLGFIALRPSDATRRLLGWWQNCCRDNCRMAFDEHIFVDQSWMDFAPAFVPRTHILHHTGYNVAYWNLHYRSIDCSGYPSSTPRMQDGSLLRFFHFSGSDPEHPHRLSKHQTRIADGTWPSWLTTLFGEYFAELDREGYASDARIPWRLNPLIDFPMPEPLRQALLRSPSVRGICMRPMSPKRAQTMAHRVLTQPDRMYRQLPVYLAELYRTRHDLRSSISDRDPQFPSKLVSWFKKSGREEFHLDHHLPADGWWNQGTGTRRVPPKPRQTQRPKVNVYGCLTAQSNAADIAQGCIRALQGSYLSLHPVNFADTAPAAALTSGPAPDLSFPNPTVDIVQITGQIQSFFADNPEVLEHSSYKIAYWDWDYDVAPAELEEVASAFDEIWCFSRWSRAVFKQSYSGPVRVVWPYPAPRLRESSRRRSPPSALSLEGKCVFLTLCDCAESPERQNAAGAVAAYLKAFPDIRDNRLLIVGLANPSLRLDYLEHLERLCAGRNDVRIVADGLCPEQVRALMQSSTALISLHASAGPLIQLAEALSLGKHVVVSDYGGAAELCASRLAHRVACRLHSTPPDSLHSPSGAHWAEADLEAASREIQTVSESWDRRRIALRARADEQIQRRSLRMHRTAIEAALCRAQSRRKSQSKHNQRLTAVIFGAGSAGERLAKTLGPLYKIVGFADNDIRKVGQRLAGYPIISPTDIAPLAPSRILIASVYWKEIHSELLCLGYRPEILRVASM